jgi:hypothetical protein
MAAHRTWRDSVQARSKGIRGSIVILMATLATLATVAPALAGVGSGPWPR